MNQKIFDDFASIQSAHAELLMRRKNEKVSAIKNEVKEFIQCAREGGAFLERPQERWTAQSLLDFWASDLYREKIFIDQALLREFSPELAPELPDAACPYRGLEAFDAKHKDLYYGRDELLTKAIQTLREHPILAVIGASGSGKSSFVLAGVLPKILSDSDRVVSVWEPLMPGGEPLKNLARVIAQGSENDPNRLEEVAAQMLANEHWLKEYVCDLKVPIVLVIDQFEEAFTMCDNKEERAKFVGNIVNLVAEPNCPHRVIITMRYDLVSRVASFGEFNTLMNRGRLDITPLSREELRSAIERPADAVKLKFEDGVVDAIISDILGEPAGLPLLQFTLLKLWETRSRNRVLRRDYETLGGARKALANSADNFFDRQQGNEQQLIKRIFLKMVRLGEGQEFVSKRILQSELYEGEASEVVNSLLTKLLEERLIRRSATGGEATAQVQVAHESLIRNWPKLAEWLEEHRDEMHKRQLLSTKAEDWNSRNRDSSQLLRGYELEEAEAYTNLRTLEKTYVEASRVHRTDEQALLLRREREIQEAIQIKRRYRRIITVVAIVLLLVLPLYQLFDKWISMTRLIGDLQGDVTAKESKLHDLESESNDARRQIALVTKQKKEAEDNLRALQAERLLVDSTLKHNQGALTNLGERLEKLQLELKHAQDALVNQSINNMLAMAGALQLKADVERGHEGIRTAVRASKYYDDLRMPPPPSLLRTFHKLLAMPVQQAGYIPTADSFSAALQFDHSLYLLNGDGLFSWNTLTGVFTNASPPLNPPIQTRIRAAFSLTSQRCAILQTTNCFLFDLSSGKQIGAFSNRKSVFDVAFSPNGAEFVTASLDGIAMHRRSVDGSLIRTLRNSSSNTCSAVDFSPDGGCIAVGTLGGDIYFFDPERIDGSNDRTKILPGYGITSLRWNQRGDRLAVGYQEGELRILKTETQSKAFTNVTFAVTLTTISRAMDGAIWNLRWHATKDFLAGASLNSGTIKVWDSRSAETVAEFSTDQDRVSDVAFTDPASLDLLGLYGEARPRLWKTIRFPRVMELPSSSAMGAGVAWSPDGHRIAEARWDHAPGIVFYPTVSSNEFVGAEMSLLTSDKGANGIAFSPSGRFFAAGDDKGYTRFWKVGSSEPVWVRNLEETRIHGVAFGVDDSLVVARNDGGIEKWTVNGDRVWSKPVMLTGEASARAIVWTADNRELVVSTDSGNIRVLNSTDGRQLRSIDVGSKTWGIAVTSDGKRIAVGNVNGTVTVWDRETGEKLRSLNVHDDQQGERIVYGVAIARNKSGQTLLAAGGSQAAFKLWNMDTWESIPIGIDAPVKQFSSGLPAIHGVAFSNDGEFVACTSAKGSTRIYYTDYRAMIKDANTFLETTGSQAPTSK